MATIVGCVVIGALVAAAGADGGVRRSGIAVMVLVAAWCYLLNWAVLVPSYAARTERWFDLTGSITYLSASGLALLAAGWSGRGALLTAMIWVWALRLGSFLFRRIRREGHDGRFDRLKHDLGRFAVTWTLQGLWVVLTAGCALAAITAADPEPLGWLAAVGVAVWASGLAVEVVADAQKSRFRQDPANEGRFITVGLWSWCQHPNYFGEIVLWTGVALTAFAGLSGWQHVTLVSPIFVMVLLTRVSGVPLQQARARKKWGDDPAYRHHTAITPLVIPRPPRRR